MKKRFLHKFSLILPALALALSLALVSCGSDGNNNTPGSGTPGGSDPGINIPSAPTGLSATTVSSTSITVSWNAVSDATGYRIYRSTDGSGPYSQVGRTWGQGSGRLEQSGLPSNTTYYYRVSTYNNSGEGALSDPVSATTGK